MSDTLVVVENVSKKFCRTLKRSLWYGVKDLSSELVGIRNGNRSLRKEEFWAVKDVSFELRRGETLGLIGPNGAGKTTVLRMLNGLIKPDVGRIEVRGRMQALIALGAGFNPILTGRENIYVNAAVLGIPKSEVDRRFDEIIDFSGIEEFIDMPVQSYSSGMAVRLGFAVAVHLEPNVMLVDEVLAVGDLAFQLKCHRKMSEFRQNGGTTVLVSHSMQAIRNVCKTGLWLENGSVKETGEAQSVCDRYETTNLNKDRDHYTDTGIQLNFDPAIRVTKIEFLNANDRNCNIFNIGDYFKLRIHFDCMRTLTNPIFHVDIYGPSDICICSCYSNRDGYNFSSLSGIGYIDFCINKLVFKPSNYLCSVFLSEDEINNILAFHEKSYVFTVVGASTNNALIQPFPTWSVSTMSESVSVL